MRTSTPPLRGKATAKAGGWAASVGVVVVIALTLISGVDYMVTESRGLDPGRAPWWISVGTTGGLVLIAVGLIVLLVGLGTMFVTIARGKDSPEPS